AELLDRLSTTPRRFTGSRWLPAGGIPTPTTFFGEPTPSIDHAAWRLAVDGVVDRPLRLSLQELRALGTTDLTAVLDCTGGWAMETTWHGVPMSSLLQAAGAQADARTVAVRSVTGWGASMSIDEARGTLLATGVAGVDLPVANGAPCRLVVPNRRGLDWVKWVSEINVAA
ncbi:MAG: molybdopterin-dependent oxidoreductase, partial [Chloroflexota bacterium]|nr:molybdopterin-dependent oxidoreductase [Chloroflexota bacterium]